MYQTACQLICFNAVKNFRSPMITENLSSFFSFIYRYGADTQIQTTEGCSVLFLASSQANPSCLSVLVDKMLAIKGDLNQATQDSITPLMIASKNGLTDNVKILLSNGVSAFSS